MKILVGIPCFNCQKQIVRVLKKIVDLEEDVDFLIVDNHSTDNTIAEITSSISTFRKEKAARFKVIQHHQNYGLGGSFKSLVEFSEENSYDYLVLFHGDDQASVSDLKMMLRLLKEGNSVDALFGARFMPESRLMNYSKMREYGNRAINKVYSIVLGKEIFDIGSGLNAYKVTSLPLKAIARYPDHIAFDINLLFHFLSMDYESRFIPIEWEERDQKSNASNIQVGLEVLKMLIRHKLGFQNYAPVKSRQKSVLVYE